jgi:urea-proton symporter
VMGLHVQIIRVSRYAIVGYGVFMGVLAIILQEIGLSLGWVYLFMVWRPTSSPSPIDWNISD